MYKECVLVDNKECDYCHECDICDLEDDKICDNCGKCLDEADYNGTIIEKVDMRSF